MNNEFKQQMYDLLGPDYDAFMSSLNDEPKKAIYMNIQKECHDETLMSSLLEHPLVKNGYYFNPSTTPLGKSPYFSCGLYYIQEPSAMLVSSFLDIQKDDYILDMCAAPGGKSCYAAMNLSHEGLLIANDIVPLRAKILSENVERFGLENTIVTNAKPAAFEKILPEFFDKIILDAPCSGEGMFRKLDQAVETWSPEKVNECAYIQKQLIDTAMVLLKPGGKLIYSTCTYNKKENEDIVNYALDQYDCHLLPLPHSHGIQPGIDMDEAVRLYPHHYNGEGHFIALLQKNGVEKVHKINALKPHISKVQRDLVADFYKTYLNKDMPTYLYENQNHIYALLPQFPELKGIRILRNGLYLGECKKNRFEPSHALALSLKKHEVKQFYDYNEDSKEIKDYLHGLSIQGTTQKGYGVLFINNLPLSFYKESQGQAKNLYPKGLRR